MGGWGGVDVVCPLTMLLRMLRLSVESVRQESQRGREKQGGSERQRERETRKVRE